MTDITKCKGVGCPSKNTCYRFLAKEGAYQWYGVFFKKIEGDEIKCDHYWEVKSKSKKKRLDKLNEF